MSSSTRLRETYLNGVASLKLANLEEAFQSCEYVEDCWKLGLCYLVEPVLLVDAPWSKVNIDFLSYVEEEEFFFSISLGYRLLSQDSQGVDKDMVHYQKNYMESSRKKRKGAEAKYAIYGYFFALQYWAYEVIESLASKFATYHGPQSPWMLCWSSDKVSLAKELVELFDRHDVSNFCNYLHNLFIYYMKSKFNFLYCSQLHI